jgi:hypothetical protein
MDALPAEQQRIKTQPIVYRKIGIRPMETFARNGRRAIPPAAF